MPYQYKREPLTQDEANRLAQACTTADERRVVWTLLDTGLRVSELASLTKANLDWQTHRLHGVWQRRPLRERHEAERHSPLGPYPTAHRGAFCAQ